MFIDITENANITPKIKSKDVLESELLKIKADLSTDDFETLTKLLNLEFSASKYYKLFKISKKFTCIIDIFYYNFYYMSLNFIKHFFESRNLNFECKYSPVYGEIHLKFKDIRLFGTCYVNFLLATISYFSNEPDALLKKCNLIISNLENCVNDSQNLNVNSEEYPKYKTLKTAKYLKELLLNLSNDEINTINNFYTEYIELLEIDFSNEEKEIFFIGATDLSNLEIF